MLEIVLGILAALGLSASTFFYLQQKKALKTSQPSLPEKEPSIPEDKINLSEVKAQAREIILAAKDDALKIKTSAEEESRRLREKTFQIEKKLSVKEEILERREQGIKRRERGIKAAEDQLLQKKKKLDNIITEELQKLEKITTFSKEEAKQEIFKKLERELTDEAARRIKDAEEYIKEEADQKAREVLLTSLRRIAVEHIPSATTSEVKLADDEIKGRIIGKEGRNIKAFEKEAGVQVEISDEPGVVVVSSYDPVRREVARIALERLIADGRIQPSRIEEIIKHTQEEVEKTIHEAGVEHVFKAGVTGLPHEIIDLLGRFKYRTSYGQNMLEHNLEVVSIGKTLAHELGANIELIKKACLLHDIGKAVSSEIEGGHAEVGADICRKYGIDEEVVQTFEGHHTEKFPNLEAVIVYLADAISGARPGARHEDYEAYIKRIKELENIANSFDGVEKSYAISAGREVRVIVKPQDISDAQMVGLAHNISRKIHEQASQFPGQIKVTVIRETRAVGVAKPKNQ